MSRGANQYPSTVEKMMNSINAYSKTANGAQKFKPSSKATNQQTKIVFAQSNTNEKTYCTNTNIICYNCEKNEHYARNCPSKTSNMNTTVGDERHEEENKSESYEHIFHQISAGYLNKDWVLLDYQSTLD